MKYHNQNVKILNILTKIAEAVPPVRSARLASAIVLKGDIISFGVNQLKTHPFQAKHAKNDQALYMHSENAAIIRALKKIDKDDLKRSTLYVARVKNPGNIWGLACPCEGCMKAIERFDIKTVVYTNDNQGYSVI
jgi:deoxycytidylate deaminase